MKEQVFPASFSLSRPIGGRTEGKHISIRIRDRVSGCEVVELRIPLEQFAMALTGLSEVPAYATWRTTALLKKREVKSVNVPLIAGEDMPYGDGREDYAARAVAPFEVDGWKANKPDFGNWHRRNGDGSYNVGFSRFVDAEEADVEKAMREMEEYL